MRQSTAWGVCVGTLLPAPKCLPWPAKAFSASSRWASGRHLLGVRPCLPHILVIPARELAEPLSGHGQLLLAPSEGLEQVDPPSESLSTTPAVLSQTYILKKGADVHSQVHAEGPNPLAVHLIDGSADVPQALQDVLFVAAEHEVDQCWELLSEKLDLPQ